MAPSSVIARRLAHWALTTLALAVLVFLPAGKLDLPALWAFLAICSVLALAAIASIDPDLARERRRPGPGGFDRASPPLIGLLLLATAVIASLDVGRLSGSDTVPLPLRVAGLACFGLGMALSVWSMAVNRFFSSVVRIQSERGHHLITAGPYRWVRHPGYAGMLLACLGAPLGIGSWYGLIPAAGCAAMVLRRAALEDPFLIEKLDGYAAYAARVRYRLLPGVW